MRRPFFFISVQKLFFLVVKLTVAVALEVGILDLRLEFLAHALVLRLVLSAAGAVSVASFEPFFYDGNKLFIKTGSVWEEIPDVNDGRHMIRQLEAFAKLVRGEDYEMPDGEYGRAIIRSIEEIYLKGL